MNIFFVFTDCSVYRLGCRGGRWGCGGGGPGFAHCTAPQAHADPPAVGQPMPTPHELRIQQWQQAPPQQRPRALPAIITTLTLDLLTALEVVEGHRWLLVEVGVGFYFWSRKRVGPWYFHNYCGSFFCSPPTLFCSHVVREPMSWRGSVWSSATSSTGVRGPPVRSCSSG